MLHRFYFYNGMNLMFATYTFSRSLHSGDTSRNKMEIWAEKTGGMASTQIGKSRVEEKRLNLHRLRPQC